jgi:hypothetical protein
MNSRLKKTLILGGVFLLFFSGILTAQNNTKGLQERLGVKDMLNKPFEFDDPYTGIEAIRGDKSRLIMLSSYITNGDGEISQCLELSSTNLISFYVDFMALQTTDVKFHFIWTGPEFYYYETDWYEAIKDEYYYLAVDTYPDWRRGIYKLIIVAELGDTASGATCVIECVMQFY